MASNRKLMAKAGICPDLPMSWCRDCAVWHCNILRWKNARWIHCGWSYCALAMDRQDHDLMFCYFVGLDMDDGV